MKGVVCPKVHYGQRTNLGSYIINSLSNYIPLGRIGLDTMSMLTKDDICFHPVVEEEKKRLQESTIAWGTLATKTISPIIYHGPQSSERK